MAWPFSGVRLIVCVGTGIRILFKGKPRYADACFSVRAVAIAGGSWHCDRLFLRLFETRLERNATYIELVFSAYFALTRASHSWRTA